MSLSKAAVITLDAMPRLHFVLALLCLSACTGRIQEPVLTARVSPSPTFAFVNGRWFEGARFVDRTLYAINGVFTDRPSATIDTTVDLGRGYVIPPFGDAHTHNLDGTFNLDTIRARYIHEGTFYVQVLTNSTTGANAVRSRWNRACDLDVTYANGGISSTLSHPFLAYEPRAMRSIPFGADWRDHAAAIRASRLRLGDAYWFIDSLPDLDGVWPRIVATRPDLLKIFLLDAREHPSAMPDTGLPSGFGLRPSVIGPLVQRARAEGLRVSAHIETAADLRLAIESGVTIFAHLPGYGVADSVDLARFAIDETTARLAGARGVTAIPTLSWSRDPGFATSEAGIRRRMENQARNIQLLRTHGATIALGSDKFGSTASQEFQEFRRLGLWTNAELLTLWGETTSRSIFPSRRIGRLEPGYEASFLVLRQDPLASLDAVGDIAMRFKQGCRL